MANKKGGGDGARRHSPNDMRSMAKNPNNPHHEAAQDNRSNQLNPQHPAYHRSRSDAGSSRGGAGAGPQPAVGESADLGLALFQMHQRPDSPIMDLGLMRRALWRSGGSMGSVMAPDYTVGFAVSSDPESRELRLVGCRKMREDESYGAAMETARAQHPQLPWRLVEWWRVEASVLAPEQDWTGQNLAAAPMPPFGPGLGAEARYWAMQLQPDSDADAAAVCLVARTAIPTPDSAIELTRDGRLGYRLIGYADSLDELR